VPLYVYVMVRAVEAPAGARGTDSPRRCCALQSDSCAVFLENAKLVN
jgi:hypothetical protein